MSSNCPTLPPPTPKKRESSLSAPLWVVNGKERKEDRPHLIWSSSSLSPFLHFLVLLRTYSTCSTSTFDVQFSQMSVKKKREMKHFVPGHITRVLNALEERDSENKKFLFFYLLVCVVEGDAINLRKMSCILVSKALAPSPPPSPQGEMGL